MTNARSRRWKRRHVRPHDERRRLARIIAVAQWLERPSRRCHARRAERQALAHALATIPVFDLPPAPNHCAPDPCAAIRETLDSKRA